MKCSCESKDPAVCSTIRNEEGPCKCQCHIPKPDCNFLSDKFYCDLKANATNNECDGYDKCIFMLVLRGQEVRP